MTGISQDNLSADLTQLVWGRCFDCPLSRYRHESWGLHGSMGRCHHSKARLGAGIFLYDSKVEHEDGICYRAPRLSGWPGCFSRFSAAVQLLW